MSALFTLAFILLFIGFIVAAIAGHILLIEALARPFFREVARAKRWASTKGLHARPT
jgi:hypothetical protein